MKTEILHKKLSRYLDGHSMPAEANQIQNWLSIVDKSDLNISEADKTILENQILEDIRKNSGYLTLLPSTQSLWQRISKLF
jgi:hypothetical protein